MRINMMKITRNLAVLAMLVVLLHLLKLLLPAPLQHADPYHLMRLVIDRQKFLMDTETTDSNSTTFPIKIDKQIINNYLLKRAHIPDQKQYENDSVLKQFMPILSLNDKANLLVTLETIVRICESANLTYFLFAGSLLGVYRHHGVIPWDDDIDLVMNASDWRKIRNVLSLVEGFELFAPSNSHWKFFKNDLSPIPGQFFKWPFIDIFFFTEDSTHVWALSGEMKTELVHWKEEIFPLQLRLFEHIKVAVPCKMEEIVIRHFGIQYCDSPTGSHKASAAFDSSRIKSIPCRQLYNIFPFVFREKDPNSGITIETLKIGNTVLRNISLPESLNVKR